MSDHPRIVTLRQYALQATKNRSRHVDAEEKQFLSQFGPQDAKPVQKLLEFEAQHRGLEFAHNRVPLYLPTLGSEHCPICFVLGNKNVPLVIYSHTGESAAPDDVATCSECDFSNPIPLV